MGWAAHTAGGRGGQILRVTTLDATGPGSFTEAVATPGPRIIVFEVGGVIDLDRAEVRIEEPFLTIAGQTAPMPGVTLIRGGLVIATHDVVVRHLRVRPGTTGAAVMSGLDFERRALSGFSFSARGSTNLSSIGMLRFRGCGPRRSRVLLRLLSEDIPRPAERTGRCNCLSSIPARQAKRGYQPCEGRRGRDREPGG